MIDINIKELRWEFEEARAGRHPQRLMRVTLDCGHYRLMPQINTIMGIGASTACRYCPVGHAPMVVNIEETGEPGSHFTQPKRRISKESCAHD